MEHVFLEVLLSLVHENYITLSDSIRAISSSSIGWSRVNRLVCLHRTVLDHVCNLLLRGYTYRSSRSNILITTYSYLHDKTGSHEGQQPKLFLGRAPKVRMCR